MKDLERIKSRRLDADDCPKLITPTKIETAIREDPADNEECLYVDFYFPLGKKEAIVTQKFRPFHIKALMKRCKLMKIKDIADWTGKLWRLEHEAFSGIGFPKYLPVQKESDAE